MPLKILILYTFNKGLLSQFFQELSERLSADGFEVTNFYLKNKQAHFKQNSVQVYGQKRASFLKNYWHVYNVIKKVAPDVILSNFSYINPAILFGKILRVPRNIAWFHTAYGHTKPSKLKVLNKTVYLNMADLVIANSKQLEAEMHQVYKVSKTKTAAIPFWTNIAANNTKYTDLKLPKSTDVCNIGCPGRLVSDKNQARVIKAVYELKQTHSKPIQLYIAGQGPFEENLHQLVSELNLEENVTFLGLLKAHEMASFYKSMDVVVLPSLHEAFGLVFIEAISLGVPVIVSDQFGALSFIENQNEVLENMTFNAKSIKELVLKLEPYITGNGLPSDYFKQIYTQNFDKDSIYDRIQNIILEN